MTRYCAARVRRGAVVAMMASVAAFVLQVPVAELLAPLVLVIGLVVWYRAADARDRTDDSTVGARRDLRGRRRWRRVR